MTAATSIDAFIEKARLSATRPVMASGANLVRAPISVVVS
jgi:hypothetical protein